MANIKVTTSRFGYMGLPANFNTVAEIEPTTGDANFWSNGRFWKLQPDDFCLYLDGDLKPIVGPIKSDGGSSSYYDLPLMGDLLKEIDSRRVGDISYIKTEELIQTVFKNNFSFGTLFKSLIRAQSVVDGVGKAGNDLEYECNKIIYYANQIKELYGNK